MLSDSWELRHGLNPRRSDTDGDGLSDGNEVLRCGTSARRRDTDGDGKSDGFEALRWGTDPRRASFRIRPCEPLAMRNPKHALFVDVGSVGGRCDDGRSVGEVSVGRPWCSLGRALEVAPGGRTVLVRGGSYPRLDLVGRRDRYLVVRPFGGERVRVAGVSGRDSSFLESGRSAGDAGFVRLEGLWITGPVQLLFGTRHVQLVGNDISSYLYLRLTRDVSIERNHIHDTPTGVRAIGVDGYAGDPRRAGTFDLTIRANRIERASYDAIAIYNGASRVLIERNEIAHILRRPGSDLHVDAIQAQGTDRLTIRDNLIHDSDDGLMLRDQARFAHLEISNNVIVRMAGWGALVSDAPHAKIEHNTIWDTGAGLGIYDLPEVPPPTTSIILKDNIVDWLQLENPHYLQTNTHNLISRTPNHHLPPRHLPHFRNPKKLDYRLAAGSDMQGIGAER
jgi:hypothetical protein